MLAWNSDAEGGNAADSDAQDGDTENSDAKDSSTGVAILHAAIAIHRIAMQRYSSPVYPLQCTILFSPAAAVYSHRSSLALLCEQPSWGPID
jgi:hypothetical protein